jgi:hypothetical protein
LAFSFFIFPTTDTYYYWTWSQHLQLSYLDGPPLIAYLLWISTHLFGNNFFAIEIIALACIYGSGILLYKIVNLYASNTVALTATALWLMYPFATTRFIAVSMTLDGLEVFFSLLIIYFAFRWIKLQNNSDIYLTIVSLLIYFIKNKEIRSIYSKYHLYLALLIAILLFSPVLLWNYYHHWISFYYQLNSHKWVGRLGAINSNAKYGVYGVWFYLTSCFFGVLNIYLLILAYAKFFPVNIMMTNVKNSTSVGNKLPITLRKGITVLIWLISLFWLFESYTKHVGLNYMITLINSRGFMQKRKK